MTRTWRRNVHRVAQRGYVAFGAATAGRRQAPDFVMVGASRSGTTSLFSSLAAHPHVRRPPLNKGVRYFDLNYERGMRWYLGHFPLRHPGMHTFEASGYYLFHPTAIQRLAADLPEAKVVMMLRDPVERAWSAWKHESARGFETESFDRALELESGRLRGQEDLIRTRPGWESRAHRHQSYRARGEYAPQLERVLTFVPPAQVHVVISEDYFADPVTTTGVLLDFLGLARIPGLPHPSLNARPGPRLPESTRSKLTAHFAPYNAALADILQRELPWQ